jgi:hypothetical protein
MDMWWIKVKREIWELAGVTGSGFVAVLVVGAITRLPGSIGERGGVFLNSFLHEVLRIDLPLVSLGATILGFCLFFIGAEMAVWLRRFSASPVLKLVAHSTAVACGAVAGAIVASAYVPSFRVNNNVLGPLLANLAVVLLMVTACHLFAQEVVVRQFVRLLSDSLGRRASQRAVAALGFVLFVGGSMQLSVDLSSPHWTRSHGQAGAQMER